MCIEAAPSARWRLLGPDMRILVRDIGGLQIVVGALMAVPLLVSLIYGEYYTALAFLLAGLLTADLGWLAYRSHRDAGEPKEPHAMVIASAGWLTTAVFGALPFLLTAHLTPPEVAQRFVPVGADYPSSLVHLADPLHALLESMSAYTTTGLTMSVHEPSVGHGILFYRHFAQWIGGAGVIVLSLAILPRPSGMSSLALYGSEATGIKLRPSILGTARAIWKMYIALTLGGAVYLAIGTALLSPDYPIGSALFDALNYAMAAQSTGGFSTLDDSIASYGSYAMELLHIPPMVIGSISIPLAYQFVHRPRLSLLWRDVQIKTFLVLVLAGTVGLCLFLASDAAAADPVREGVFQFISAATTTGWQTSNIGDWSAGSVVFMVAGGMIVGGAAGATAGGIKLIRAYLIARGVGWRISRVFLPKNAVVVVPLGQRTLTPAKMTDELADAAAFTLLYLLILAASIVITANAVPPEFSFADVVFEAASAQGTVGLSSNITGPDMPRLVEVIYILQMWVGRLEIIPVLVLFRVLFFGIRRR